MRRRCAGVRRRSSSLRANGSTRTIRRRSGRRCGRSCRPSSGRAWTRVPGRGGGGRRFRSRPRGGGSGSGGGAWRDQPLLLARRLHLQGRLEDRERPAQARWDHGRPGRKGSRLSCPVPGTAASRGRPASRRAAPPGGVETIGSLAALEDDRLRACFRASSGRSCATGPARIDPRRLDLTSETVSISAEETFPRDVADVGAAAGGAASPVRARRRTAGRPDRQDRHDEGPLHGLLDPVALDLAPRRHRRRDANLGARLRVSRPRAGRPSGALRLVGVGVSGLEAHRQLELV